MPSWWRRTRAQQLTAGFGHAHGRQRAWCGIHTSDFSSKPRQKPHSFPPSRADGLSLPLSLHREPSDQGRSMVCRPAPTWPRLVLKAAVAQTQSSPYLEQPKGGASQIQSIPDPEHAKSRASQTWSCPCTYHTSQSCLEQQVESSLGTNPGPSLSISRVQTIS